MEGGLSTSTLQISSQGHLQGGEKHRVDLLLDRKAKESKLHRLSQDLSEFILSSSSSTAVRRQAAKPKGSRAATPTLVAIKLANVVVKSPGRCAISEAF
jgi:hypothetical protein